MVATRLMTAKDLEEMGSEAEKRFELIDGVLVEVEAMGGRHGSLSAGIVVDLGGFTRRNKLGKVFTEGTRFQIAYDPDIVLMPDVAFVRANRIPREGIWESTVPIPPDLATEVASPNDTDAEVRRKARRYLDAGVLLVWIVWPRKRAVSVLRPGEPEVMLFEKDELDGGEVVPGFRLKIASIFND